MIFFDTIVKRVTNFSIQSFEKNKKDIATFFSNNELFQLSILTSSTVLYEDIKKNKSDKIKASLSKYFIRAHFNPTPFGVFSSVGTLKWGEFTAINKDKTVKLNVKYDNLFLTNEINNTITSKWHTLSYCINPTIHFLNDYKIGFYKSKNLLNDKIELSYGEIDYDDDLQWIIDRFKNCIKVNIVLEELILSGFERVEVESYLFEIIEAGLIIEEFLYFPFAEKLANQNSQFPSNLVQRKNFELKNENDFKLFKKNYIEEQKNFFQNSSFHKYSHSINSFDLKTGSLDLNIQDKISRYIDFTIQYNSETQAVNDTLNKFISKLSDRFVDGFIPINTVFNPYSGVNYTSLKVNYKNKLHKDIVLKIFASTKKNIILNMPIINDIKIKQRKMPATFNVILEILYCKITGKKVIYMQKLAGVSALNVLSRFTEATNDLCKEIVNYEKEVHFGKIIADISCIGNNRSINIAPEKQMYDYCIPINTSFKENSNPIFLNDIYVHLRDGVIALVSKKNRQQILPRKTSFINPNLSDSELYKFLCDLEIYNEEIYGVNFDFNGYEYFNAYIPRIYLEEDVLLYPAQLLLIYNDFSICEFTNYLKSKIEEHSFSRMINFLDIKGNLILNTESEIDIIELYEKLKKRKYFYVSESLYESFNPEIVRESENFPHELIVSVKNTDYINHNASYNFSDLIKNNNIPIFSDWLYIELYCNSYADIEVLKSIYTNTILEKKCTKFFFIHYSNPDRHLRLRFKTSSLENKELIIKTVHELKIKEIIGTYVILPYEQETHRYGGLELMEFAETIFDLDTQDLLSTVIEKELSKDSNRIISILKIKNYLEFFGYSIDEMIEYCENCIVNFSAEFELNSQLRKDFNKEFSEIKMKIGTYEYESFLHDNSLKNNLLLQLEKSNYHLKSYSWLLIHMSMNRHFNEKQRYNEFKSYYLTKCYLNQIKFKKQ